MKEQQSQNFKMVDEDNLNLVKIVKDYLRYWPWFILSILVFLLAGYFYLLKSPIIYETSAKIKVLAESKVLELEASSLSKNYINLENDIEILTSYPILKRVEKELELSQSFYTNGDYRLIELDTLPFSYQYIFGTDSLTVNGNYKINVTPKTFEVYNYETDSTTSFLNHDTRLIQHKLPFQIRMESQDQLASCLGREFYVFLKTRRAAVLSLKGSIEVTPLGDDSEILQLTMQGENFSKSERILNSLIKSYNEDGIQDRQLTAKTTLEFIDDRFASLSKELDSIELNKEDFKQVNKLVDIKTDTDRSIEKRINSDEEVFRVDSQLALLELLDEAINDPNTKSRLLPSNFGLESPEINRLVQNYNEAIINSEEIINSGGVNNPIVRQSLGLLDDLRTNIEVSIKGYRNQLLFTQKQLSSRDREFRSDIYMLPEKEKLLRAIERQQEIKESLFLLLLEKREEVSIELAVTKPSVKVVEYAITGSFPVSPNSRVIYVATFLAGLFVPFGVLFVLFFLDNKIDNKKDLEKLVLDIPISGEIPKIKEETSLVFSNPNDRSLLAESFRMLSSNINYLMPVKDDGKGSVIYVSSAIKGEGKSFVSLNLSLAFSSLNKKVLLIGADLRSPQLHAYMGVDKNQLGLSNYLNDSTNVQWKEILINAFKDHNKHDTLISGVVPENPPNLITNGSFEKLLEEAKMLYDYIIVDTPPTVSVTDTLLISGLADTTVYLVRANYTEKPLLEHSIALGKNNKLKNMTYVINQVGAKSGDYYGKGYGYGEQTIKRSWMDKIFSRFSS